MDQLHTLLSRLERAYLKSDFEDQKILENCLVKLINLMGIASDEGPNGKEALSQVARYATKKLSEAELSSHTSPGSALALRQLRNELNHGRSLKRLEYSRIKKLEPVLWRTLEMSSQLWDPTELTNFLTYCLRTETAPLPITHVDPKKLVRVYRAIYNTFEEEEKEQAFKELALRLFSEKRFVTTLEKTLAR